MRWYFLLSLILIVSFELTAQESGVYEPKIAYSEKGMKFLAVYLVKYTSSDGIYGVFLDRRGIPGLPVTISKVTVGKSAVAYSASKDIFFVPYHYCTNACTLEGQIVYPDRNVLDTPVQIAVNTYGYGDIVAAADDGAEKFIVLWMDNRNRSTPQIFGRFVNFDGTVPNQEVLIIKNASTVSGFDLVRDTVNKRYLFVYSASDVNGYSVFAQVINDDLTLDRTVKVATSNDYNCRVSVTYGKNERLFFLAYTDYQVGVNSYNIKALALDENL
ncbi:MAG: hypothetical protein N3B13_10075, partial [Deltaproteobacteria bacterium]|nr:hypothetical protein [Deltaproteobacteria bacterium]